MEEEESTFFHLPRELQACIFGKLTEMLAEENYEAQVAGASAIRETSKRFGDVALSMFEHFFHNSVRDVDPLDHHLLLQQLNKFPRTTIVVKLQRMMCSNLYVVRNLCDAKRFARRIVVHHRAACVFFVWSDTRESKRARLTHVPKLERALRIVAKKIPLGTIVLFDHGIRAHRPVSQAAIKLPDVRRMSIYANFTYVIDYCTQLTELFACDLFPTCASATSVGIGLDVNEAPHLKRIAGRPGHMGALLHPSGNPLRSMEAFVGIGIRDTRPKVATFPKLKTFVVERCFYRKMTHTRNPACSCCRGVATAAGVLLPDTIDSPWSSFAIM